jgi:SHS2 domain-containing protein
MLEVLPRHVFEDHVGEVRLRVEAPTLAMLFEEAARGLAELLLDEADETASASAETISIRAADRDGLLVDWLNELIFLSETRHRVYTEARVARISDTELEALVHGVVPKTIRTAVKAATLHALEIDVGPDGYFATVTLDV